MEKDSDLLNKKKTVQKMCIRDRAPSFLSILGVALTFDLC